MVIILLKISYKVLTLLTSVLPVERHTLSSGTHTGKSTRHTLSLSFSLHVWFRDVWASLIWQKDATERKE